MKNTNKKYVSCIVPNNNHVIGMVDTNINLTLKQKIKLFFSKGVRIIIKGNDVVHWCNMKYDLREKCNFLDKESLRCYREGVCLGQTDHPCTELYIKNTLWIKDK